MGEIVVMPCAIVNQLEHMDVFPDQAEEMDVLKVVVESHISVQLAGERGSWSTGDMREIVVAPNPVVNQLVDMDAFPNGAKKKDVLIMIVGGLIANKGVSDSLRGTAQMSEIVVMPCAVVNQLVDMEIGSDEVDMLPVLARGALVTCQRAHPARSLFIHCFTSGWSTGQLGQIAMMPSAIVVQLVNVKVGANEVDVLLVIAGAHVARRAPY